MKYSHLFVLSISDVLSSLTITSWVKFLAIVMYKMAKGYIKNLYFLFLSGFHLNLNL